MAGLLTWIASTVVFVVIVVPINSVKQIIGHLIGKPPRNLWLQGQYAPVEKEFDSVSCPVVEGTIPEDLAGIYLRNGANPRYRPWFYHWFGGDGMIHSVTFAAGKAVYKNRFVRTAKFLSEEKAGKSWLIGLGNVAHDALFLIKAMWQTFKLGGLPPLNVANTSLIVFNNKLLALSEIASPTQITPDLDTIGEYTLDGQWKHPFTAHPKFDIDTNEMVFYGISMFVPPYRWYGVADCKTGKVTTQLSVPQSAVKLQHDFAITTNYSIMNEVPLFATAVRLLWGQSPFHFSYTDATRFGILPRHLTSADQAIWIEAPSMFIYHTAGAWEEKAADGSQLIVFIAVTYPATDAFDLFKHPKIPAKDQIPTLSKFVFNLSTKSIASTTALYPRGDHKTGPEFPLINPDLYGKKFRYIWMGDFDPALIAIYGIYNIVKLDLETNETIVQSLGEDMFGGESTFFSRGSGEDNGYLANFVIHNSTKTGFLRLFDAKTLSPICRIQTPQIIPLGFHGHWLTAAEVATLNAACKDAKRLPSQDSAKSKSKQD